MKSAEPRYLGYGMLFLAVAFYGACRREVPPPPPPPLPAPAPFSGQTAMPQAKNADQARGSAGVLKSQSILRSRLIPSR